MQEAMQRPSRRADSPEISTPKRSAAGRQTYWTRYYAGFSEHFAVSALQLLAYNPNVDVVLDPWNGAGTTTAACAKLGLRSCGIDVNPVAVAAARARTFDAIPHDLITLSDAPLKRIPKKCAEADPLLAWLDARTTLRLRQWQRHLIEEVLSRGQSRPPRGFTALANTILFDAVRSLASSARSSNPTWVRSSIGDAVSKSSDSNTDAIVRRAARNHIEHLLEQKRIETQPVIRHGKVQNVAMGAEKFSIVLTSPPYLTRLDYAVSTSLELAVLQFTKSDIDRLRHKITGSPLLRARRVMPRVEWGALAIDTLWAVASHESKASHSYYAGLVAQYLDDMSRSLKRVSDLAARSARIGIVVQDSYYKNVHLDIGAIITEMLQLNGWILTARHSFAATRSLARINPRSQSFGKQSAHTESALFFSR